MSPDIWILTPAPASRLADVTECHNYAGIPEERRVIVTNPPNSIMPGRNVKGTLIDTGDPDLNISKWWNAGLRYIRDQYRTPTREYVAYNVFLAESDVRISYEDICKMSYALELFQAGVAGANWYGLPLEDNEYVFSYKNKHWGHDEAWRFPGVGCLIQGNLGLEFDEEFRWWYADCDMLFQHRAMAGSVLVGGTSMQHHGGTPMDTRRTLMAEEDHAKFLKKWNMVSY